MLFLVFLFVFFFVWSLSSHSRVFHSNGDVTITGERLQILTNVRRSWPLSNEDNLGCHTYCDTGHSFIWSSSRTREIHTCCQAFISGDYITCFNDIDLSRLGFKHPTYRMANTLSDCSTAAVCFSFLLEFFHLYKSLPWPLISQILVTNTAKSSQGIEEMAFKTCTVFASWQGINLSNFQELAAYSLMNLLLCMLVTGYLCSDLNEIL